MYLNRNPDQNIDIFFPTIETLTESGSVYNVWIENSLQFKEAIDNATTFSETIPPSAERNLVFSTNRLQQRMAGSI